MREKRHYELWNFHSPPRIESWGLFWLEVNKPSHNAKFESSSVIASAFVELLRPPFAGVVISQPKRCGKGKLARKHHYGLWVSSGSLDLYGTSARFRAFRWSLWLITACIRETMGQFIFKWSDLVRSINILDGHGCIISPPPYSVCHILSRAWCGSSDEIFGDWIWYAIIVGDYVLNVASDAYLWATL